MLRVMTATEFESTWRSKIDTFVLNIDGVMRKYVFTYWNVCPVCNIGVLSNSLSEVIGFKYNKIHTCQNEHCGMHFKMVPIGDYIDAKVFYGDNKEEVEQAN